MPTDCISYQNSGYFSPLMNDYLDQKTIYTLYIIASLHLKTLRTNPRKAGQFRQLNRVTLVSVLQNNMLVLKPLI
jgi:hypothetical protein